MPELNKCNGVDLITAPLFDPLTVTNMGDGVLSLAQADEEGNLHHVIINEDMAASLMPILARYLG